MFYNRHPPVQVRNKWPTLRVFYVLAPNAYWNLIRCASTTLLLNGLRKRRKSSSCSSFPDLGKDATERKSHVAIRPSESTWNALSYLFPLYSCTVMKKRRRGEKHGRWGNEPCGALFSSYSALPCCCCCTFVMHVCEQLPLLSCAGTRSINLMNE